MNRITLLLLLSAYSYIASAQTCFSYAFEQVYDDYLIQRQAYDSFQNSSYERDTLCVKKSEALLTAMINCSKLAHSILDCSALITMNNETPFIDEINDIGERKRLVLLRKDFEASLAKIPSMLLAIRTLNENIVVNYTINFRGEVKPINLMLRKPLNEYSVEIIAFLKAVIGSERDGSFPEKEISGTIKKLKLSQCPYLEKVSGDIEIYWKK